MKDVWHSIDKGSFTRNKIEYDYVVEQNKNEMIKAGSTKNIRVRIVHKTPEVTKVRTRYDPVIESYGMQGGAMPVNLGYSVKHLKSYKKTFWIMVLGISWLVANFVLVTFWKINMMSWIIDPIVKYFASLGWIPTIAISTTTMMIANIVFAVLVLYMMGKVMGRLLAKYFRVQDTLAELKAAGKLA